MENNIVIHGVTNGAGKSCVSAGISTLLREYGIDVFPFQPVSFTDYIYTVPGGEICATKAYETMLVRRKPIIDTNPVIIKPPGSYRIKVRGKEVVEYGPLNFYRSWRGLADESLRTLPMMKNSADLLICESFGNPSDCQLRATEFAALLSERIDPKIVLVGDIDRCGVFAGVLGTIELLADPQRDRIKGIIINKFRGDPSILGPAFEAIEDRTGVPTMGIIPYIEDLPAGPSLRKTEKLARTVREVIGKDSIMDILLP